MCFSLCRCRCNDAHGMRVQPRGLHLMRNMRPVLCPFTFSKGFLDRHRPTLRFDTARKATHKKKTSNCPASLCVRTLLHSLPFVKSFRRRPVKKLVSKSQVPWFIWMYPLGYTYTYVKAASPSLPLRAMVTTYKVNSTSKLVGWGRSLPEDSRSRAHSAACLALSAMYLVGCPLNMNIIERKKNPSKHHNAENACKEKHIIEVLLAIGPD